MLRLQIMIFGRYYCQLKKKEITNIYLDPPYIGCEKYYNDGNFSFQDHLDLSEILNNKLFGCKIIISYYEVNEIYNLYPKDKWIYIYLENTKSSKGLTKHTKKYKREKVREVLILNYEPKISQKNLFT